MANRQPFTHYVGKLDPSDSRIPLRAYLLAELRHYYDGGPKPEKPPCLRENGAGTTL
jgi:hypothetical protein